jgi:hypothetical protein
MATPFYAAFDSIATPNGTWIKPGGNVVAYVRSTGVQSGDLSPIADNLVSTIAAGVNRCRAGMNDVVMVLPGHTETVTTTLFTAVSGAQIIGAGIPGASNAPNVTLSATAATIALSAANMTIAGLNINSSTAAVTGAIVITGAGVTLANNFISFTGALGANPLIQVTGAANCTIANNHIVCNSTNSATTGIINVTLAASTNFVVQSNLIRQSLATGPGNFMAVADTAGISGFVNSNVGKTAFATTPGLGFVLNGANVIANVMNFDNWTLDNVATGATLATGATAV